MRLSTAGTGAVVVVASAMTGGTSLVSTAGTGAGCAALLSNAGAGTISLLAPGSTMAGATGTKLLTRPVLMAGAPLLSLAPLLFALTAGAAFVVAAPSVPPFVLT